MKIAVEGLQWSRCSAPKVQRVKYFPQIFFFLCWLVFNVEPLISLLVRDLVSEILRSYPQFSPSCFAERGILMLQPCFGQISGATWLDVRSSRRFRINSESCRGLELLLWLVQNSICFWNERLKLLRFVWYIFAFFRCSLFHLLHEIVLLLFGAPARSVDLCAWPFALNGICEVSQDALIIMRQAGSTDDLIPWILFAFWER